jgi:plastocyanin
MKALAWFLFLGSEVAVAATVQVQVGDSAGRPLADAVVFLESREARQAVRPALGTEMAQAGKQFDPRVLVVPLGTSVVFPNRDTVRHHVYSFSPAKTFELKLFTGTAANPVVFDKVGVAVLGCNIHDNMAAWVVVVDTPHYGRSAASGAITIPNVPAGNYRLRVWHPGLPVGAPAADQALVVGASDLVTTFRLAGVSP